MRQVPWDSDRPPPVAREKAWVAGRIWAGREKALPPGRVFPGLSSCPVPPQPSGSGVSQQALPFVPLQAERDGPRGRDPRAAWLCRRAGLGGLEGWPGRPQGPPTGALAEWTPAAPRAVHPRGPCTPTLLASLRLTPSRPLSTGRTDPAAGPLGAVLFGGRGGVSTRPQPVSQATCCWGRRARGWQASPAARSGRGGA